MADTWTFGSIAFRRQVSGDEPQWFRRTRERTVDVIASTGTRIVDEGATTYAPLSFVALLSVEADADALESAYATSATLTSPTGRSGTALLVVADRLVEDGVYARVFCEFELVSS